MAQSVAELIKPPASDAPRTTGGPALRQVRLQSMTWEAPGVLSLMLTAADGGTLVPFEPGAHIDLQFPDGTTRQYSLCGDPSDTSRYRIGVRAVSGGVCSQFIHRRLRPGDLLKVSKPRNLFALVKAPRYIFVAGGIGITPLIPMMRAASARGTPWKLIYCNRRNEDAPFLTEVLSFGGEVSLHSTEAGTRLDVTVCLGTVQEGAVIYCCGPERLMAAVEEATTAWPPETVRFEWFSPRSRSLDELCGSFQVVCEASGVTLTVPPDRTVLSILNDAGIEVPCSCQQGICGTCEVRVLSGEVEHRDSILSLAERAANETMMICVSRARGSRLVLDI